MDKYLVKPTEIIGENGTVRGYSNVQKDIDLKIDAYLETVGQILETHTNKLEQLNLNGSDNPTTGSGESNCECANSSYSFTKVNDDLTFQVGIGTLDHCLESNAESIATLADKMSNMNTGSSSGSECLEQKLRVYPYDLVSVEGQLAMAPYGDGYNWKPGYADETKANELIENALQMANAAYAETKHNSNRIDSISKGESGDLYSVRQFIAAKDLYNNYAFGQSQVVASYLMSDIVTTLSENDYNIVQVVMDHSTRISNLESNGGSIDGSCSCNETLAAIDTRLKTIEETEYVKLETYRATYQVKSSTNDNELLTSTRLLL